MTFTTVFSPRLSGKAAAFVALAALLNGCGSPERLPSDLSTEVNKEVLAERVIAPIKAFEEEQEDQTAFATLPRRKLIQVRHAPSSLQDRYFVSNLAKLLSHDGALDVGTTNPQTPTRNPSKLSEAEHQKIKNKRSLERTQILVQKGLNLENDALDTLRTLDGLIDTSLGTTVGGVNGGTLPIFGRTLNGDGETYLELPSDLIFVGGNNGTIGSKTALLKTTFNNPEIVFSVRDMPLSEALSFLFGSAGLQATTSEAVINLEAKVSMSVQASAIAIIDSLLEQNELAIVYDPYIEVALVYTEPEFEERLAKVRASIEAYNGVLKEKKNLDKLQNERARILELIQYIQLLLSGDDEGFMIGIESISRDPAGPETSAAISKMTLAAIDLQNEMARFDLATTNQLAGTTGISGLAVAPELSGRTDLEEILSEDPCVLPRHEIYTEKLAVYDAAIFDEDTPENGMVGKIKAFFSEVRDQQSGDNNIAGFDNNTVGETRPSYCGENNPAPTTPIILPDETGITVIGTRTDNDLVARLVEQYDVPQLQVLIEIFIITVSRDFSRQIDSLLTLAPSAGGNSVAEASLRSIEQLVEGVGTGATRTFNLNLNAPNNSATAGYTDDLGAVFNLLESNNLGRVVSSPTILVADGGRAEVKRNQIAQVERIVDVIEGDNGTGDIPVRDFVPYEAEFTLNIEKVDINRLNETVKIDVRLVEERFATALTEVQEDTAKTADEINTTFWASPGDVIVLAGIAQNTETNATTGLPGTTNNLAPISPLLGGSDGVTNNMSETMIFLAPTVINPAAENQPHSAFRKRPRRNIVN